MQSLTPGVLTKADTVQEGDHPHWFDILYNKSHYLLLGYFATMLPGPSPKVLNPSPTSIRDIAKRFFGKKPWNQVDKSRLGVDNLVEDLSLRLSKMINARSQPLVLVSKLTDRLPNLIKEVQLSKRNIHQQLDNLPRSFSESPQAMLLNLCNEFTGEIQERVNGSRRPPRFFQQLDAEYHRLAKELTGTRPNFEITPNEDDQDDDLYKVSKNDSPQGRQCPCRHILLTTLTDTIKMASVRAIIGQMSTRELPGNIPFAAHEHFDTLFVSKWKSITLNSFEMVEQLLREMVQSLCVQHFGRFNTSGLLKAVR